MPAWRGMKNWSRCFVVWQTRTQFAGPRSKSDHDRPTACLESANGMAIIRKSSNTSRGENRSVRCMPAALIAINRWSWLRTPGWSRSIAPRAAAISRCQAIPRPATNINRAERRQVPLPERRRLSPPPWAEIQPTRKPGMGVVYKAMQKRLNRTVAVKMILAGELADQDDVRRFLAEAEAAAGLDHPGIVPVYESGEIAGQHFFSMGYVDGQSLAALLATGPLPPRRVAELVAQVADAVDFAHERGVGKVLQHGDMVNAVAVSRDGGQVATGSADRSVRVWDTSTHQEVAGPFWHTQTVTSVALIPGAMRVVSGCEDGTAAIWDGGSNSRVGLPMRHAKAVRKVSVSHDGSRILTASDDETARLWDADSGAPVGEPMRHESTVNFVAFCPDGKRFMTASTAVYQWSAETMRAVSDPLDHRAKITCASYSPDGELL